MHLQIKKACINTKLMPAFYQEFHCLMDKCHKDCCDDGWKIAFSKKDYLKIMRVPKSPELEQRMRQAMRRIPKEKQTREMYAEFVNFNNKCPFHNEKGLCELQLECGAEVLPFVCRIFPRKPIFTHMAKEYSLSTGCEAVVELLWNHPEGIDFIEEPLERQQWLYEIHTHSHTIFPIIRSVCIDILQNRQYSISERLLLLGIVLDKLQKEKLNIDIEQWEMQTQQMLQGPKMDLNFDMSQNSMSLFNYCKVVMENLYRIPYFYRLLQSLSVEKTSSFMENDVKKESIQTRYDKMKQAVEEKFGDIDYLWENLLVNTWFYLSYPDTNSPDKLWKSYVNFCNIYNFLRHTIILGCGMEPTKEKFVHGVVMGSRYTLHSSARQAKLQEQLFKNDSATLAHMAILVQD